MTKHTPGPWKRLHSEGSMICANGLHVASVPVGGPIDNPAFQANASLIAAAPDLLEALKALLNCPAIADEDHHDPTWGDGETAQAKSLALAAISKATA